MAVPLLADASIGLLCAAGLGILLLLVCSALISGSEIAYFSLSDNELVEIEQESDAKAQRLLALLDEPRRLLATILISNNIVNIAIVILSEMTLGKIWPSGAFTPAATWLGKVSGFDELTQIASIEAILSFIIRVVLVTFLLVLFGEIAPKVYAQYNARRLALFMARPLQLLKRLFRWPSSLLVGGTRRIEARIEARNNQTITSREELDEAIELTFGETNEGDEAAEQDTDMLKGILKFGDTAVKQIMRPRIDVIALDMEQDYHEVLATIRESGYSRFPVIEQNFDHIKGILYAKTLLGHLKEGPDFGWQEMINTDLLYVPESKKIDDQLRDFQKERQHMAIVVDEYGGGQGIVTLEDILEEVIGDIKDEFDDPIEIEYEKVDDHTYIFEGKTLLHDMCRVFGVDTQTFDAVRGESDSIGGLILEILGDFPELDSEVPFKTFTFRTLDLDDRRITRVLVTRTEPMDET